MYPDLNDKFDPLLFGWIIAILVMMMQAVKWSIDDTIKRRDQKKERSRYLSLYKADAKQIWSAWSRDLKVSATKENSRNKITYIGNTNCSNLRSLYNCFDQDATRTAYSKSIEQLVGEKLIKFEPEALDMVLNNATKIRWKVKIHQMKDVQYNPRGPYWMTNDKDSIGISFGVHSCEYSMKSHQNYIVYPRTGVMKYPSTGFPSFLDLRIPTRPTGITWKSGDLMCIEYDIEKKQLSFDKGELSISQIVFTNVDKQAQLGCLRLATSIAQKWNCYSLEECDIEYQNETKKNINISARSEIIVSTRINCESKFTDHPDQVNTSYNGYYESIEGRSLSGVWTARSNDLVLQDNGELGFWYTHNYNVFFRKLSAFNQRIAYKPKYSSAFTKSIGEMITINDGDDEDLMYKLERIVWTLQVYSAKKSQNEGNTAQHTHIALVNGFTATDHCCSNLGSKNCKNEAYGVTFKDGDIPALSYGTYFSATCLNGQGNKIKKADCGGTSIIQVDFNIAAKTLKFWNITSYGDYVGFSDIKISPDIDVRNQYRLGITLSHPDGTCRLLKCELYYDNSVKHQEYQAAVMTSDLRSMVYRKGGQSAKIYQQTHKLLESVGKIEENIENKEKKRGCNRVFSTISDETYGSDASATKLATDLQELRQIKGEFDHVFAQSADALQEKIKKLQGEVEKGYCDWTVDEIIDWVNGLENGKFSIYQDILKNHFWNDDIKGSDLPLLTMSDLRMFGVFAFSDRLQLIKCFQNLCRKNETSMEDESDDEPPPPLEHINENNDQDDQGNQDDDMALETDDESDGEIPDLEVDGPSVMNVVNH